MPSSSMRLTSVASVKRGGGSVKCWVASIFSRVTGSPCVHAPAGGRRPRPPRRRGLPDRARESPGSERPDRWRAARARARRLWRRCRRWCAPARPIPSGWRWCASRSARRAWPVRVRDIWPRPWAVAPGRSGGSPHALPARSWPSPYICAEPWARNARHIPCRSRCARWRPPPAPCRRRRFAYR